ncbi:hypothetical protein COT48_02540 [Candidatus Woesearchaeota archaeon CG08_land_8_20_14_0_20_47_9]|nr:MAG: hypothetical protein AUJ69_04070 [Candidatus Woesearchaeota archaeon CG1_02_47_18]PIN72003.1 MAG: hypothetical protein COV22_04305 [Candidatus Woesearchaeota archaeon CG10_big_fil_rev_8_21_14_0_10_47_5]PIO04018.1 MAG: hypothetical protein COT48_02540 [Candidatus Woesearchaeota archaeon CG08_land_8_20_14_0_20_47_9]HII30135.1 hypothetical protein [Candidatus Woesearchaeota archaeon]
MKMKKHRSAKKAGRHKGGSAKQMTSENHLKKRHLKHSKPSTKDELISLAASLIIFIIILKLVFYNEAFMVTARLAASIFWMFTLPGYAVMLYWRQRLDFLTRLVIGTVLGACIFGVAAYYLGIVGLQLGRSIFVVPAVVMGVGVWVGCSINIK